MKTEFTLAQLQDPGIAEANGILRACVHCGFCTATCPTYVVLGDERDSPRGRIYLIKDMLERGAPAAASTVTHIDRCLTCLSCITSCPASVDYMHLLEEGRAHIAKTYRRPLFDRLVRALLDFVLPHPRRFRLALRLAGFAKPFAALAPHRFKAMLALASPAKPARPPVPRKSPPAPVRRAALLAGCVEPVLRPEIRDATLRLLERRSVAAFIAEGSGCCGALSHHLSKPSSTLDFAKANIDAWMREIEGQGLDAIIVTAPGCGTHLKDYGHLLRRDPAYAEKAARISAMTRDISEFLAEIGLGEGAKTPPLAVTYHSACSLQHGQKVNAEPRALLRQCGFTVREPREGHLCCGSAGVYNLLEPEISESLLKRKAAHLEAAGGDVIATGNIGCLMQIKRASALPIVHTVELLDWATGGPCPAELSAVFAESA